VGEREATVRKYLDFDLEIEKSESGYRARVLNSPTGQAAEAFNLPFSDLEVDNFILRLGRPRRGVRRLESTEMTAAKEFGGRLFDSVFEGAVLGVLQGSLNEASQRDAGLRIRLRLSGTPELVDLPWEYLYDSSLNRFLSLSVDTPVIRYLDLPGRIEPLAVMPPLRVLVMISSPQDYPTLDTETEWAKLKEAVADLEKKGWLVLDRLEQPTLAALQHQLRRKTYHIFHFVGHGGFDESAQDGVLVLEDEEGHSRQVSGQYLGMLLHDEKTLRLAILNACEGGRTSRSDLFAGVGQSLLQQGIPAVIAMQFPILDEAAITMAHEFYSALADGYPVDAALSEARKGIFAQDYGVEWGTPVLYLRAPDGRIFDIEKDATLAPVSRTRREAARAKPVPPPVAAPEPVPPPVAAPEPTVPEDRAWSWERLRLPLALVGLLGLALVIGVVVVAGLVGGPGEPAPIPTTSVPLVAEGPTSTHTPQPSVVTPKTQPPPTTASLHDDIWTRPTDDMEMVYVPGGTFEMGSTDAEVEAVFEQCEQAGRSDDCQRNWLERESPRHSVTLDSFWIDRTEVTNAQYARCVADGTCISPPESKSATRDSYYGEGQFDDYPVMWVSWSDADAYCQWAGGRLPTEAEWEYAARGPDGNVYPWGNDPPDDTLLNYDSIDRDTTEVGSYPDGASWVGALDMAGNVWEWVSDWYAEYAASPAENPTGPDTGDEKVLRGGSWNFYPPSSRSAFRLRLIPINREYDAGLRCVVASPPSP
jgi:formylglycine-generating enzyme required for sulfatase activity